LNTAYGLSCGRDLPSRFLVAVIVFTSINYN
jgi:hypothetical protein